MASRAQCDLRGSARPWPARLAGAGKAVQFNPKTGAANVINSIRMVLLDKKTGVRPSAGDGPRPVRQAQETVQEAVPYAADQRRSTELHGIMSNGAVAGLLPGHEPLSVKVS